MKDVLQMFAVALGFEVDKASQTAAVKSIADYEKAVKEAEKRIEDARWEGAKTDEEIAKLTRETRLKEARAALAEAQDREKSEKESARKREERNKEFIAGWNKAALAVSAAATAISYAVGRVTSAFDNLGFVSQRTGASVQSLNSLGYAFKQTGGSAQQAIGSVEKFAQALRNNPGLKGFVKDLGVDTSKDMGDQYLDTVSALSKQPYYVGSQQAGMLGISEEDYKLVSDHLQQIRDYRAEYNRTTQSLGVDSQQATEASQSFWRSLTKLQATASALTDKLMVSLAPALEAIIKKFNDWIAANPERIEQILKGISQALEWVAQKAEQFAEWIMGSGGDLLMKRWENFAERVERVARAVDLIAAGIVKVLGLVERMSGTRTPWGDQSRLIAGINQLGTEQAAGGGGDDRNWWQRHAPSFLGGRDAPSGGTARIGRLAQNTNAQAIIGELRQAGYNSNAIAAIVGSMQTESSFNPGASNNQSGGHTGLWQWDRNRWPKIAKWIKDQGGNPMDARWQTRAWVAEHNARPGDPIYDHARTQRGGAILRNNPSLDDAIHGVRESERFGAGEEGGRAANARGWLPHVGAQPAPAPAPTSLRTPGNFDPNHIDPANLMQPAPSAASPTTNNNTNSRSVSQNITNNVNVQTAGDPRTASRLMEGTLGRVHSLALANAQSAVV
ncbi:phage tail tip lysozyme [Methylobacterium sp. J-067]|uniref:phage tail tip lysozyme n=1 Tax=Methylobacterium sp. J-067 TaxID=2836648 RepID=UPI001FBB2932|nr:phage tail tip lysozyme [Methylobacterium sp. J-067]MCJ2023926.1 phage tail tip lysozyme [Methylobacterium sp. J-067]